jgi:hypothetical protein
MIQVNKEFYSSPYYFLLRDKGSKYSLYFSVEETLTEARKKDDVIHFKKEKGNDVKKYLNKTIKLKKTKDKKTLKKDLEELVNSDGAMGNSKIPILDPRLHPRKTMDQTVAASSITNDPISRGYRTYYGESVDKLSEIDMSDAFGYEETKDMDGKETYEYFKDELEMEPEEAKERTKQQGKDPKGKKDERSEYSEDPNFIGKLTLSEIQKQKMIKVVEDILTKKQKDDLDITKKTKNAEDMPILIRKNLKSLLRQCDKHNVSKKELINLIKGEQ